MAAGLPDAVLRATRDAVLAVGVRRTTLTDVARRAGVSRMTLYRMVPDVTGLILALMTREFADLLDDAAGAAGRRRTARARLVTTAVEVVRRLPDEPLFRRVVEVDPELLLPYLTGRRGSTQVLAAAFARDQIRAGQADGSIRRADADLLASALVLTVTAWVVAAPRGDADAPAARDELARLLDRWLRR